MNNKVIESESEFDDTEADPNYEEAASEFDGTDADVNDEEPENTDCEIKSKKRRKHPDRWLQNLRKLKRNTGESYISKSGKLIPARQYGECECKKNVLESLVMKSNKNYAKSLML